MWPAASGKGHCTLRAPENPGTDTQRHFALGLLPARVRPGGLSTCYLKAWSPHKHQSHCGSCSTQPGDLGLDLNDTTADLCTSLPGAAASPGNLGRNSSSHTPHEVHRGCCEHWGYGPATLLQHAGPLLTDGPWSLRTPLQLHSPIPAGSRPYRPSLSPLGPASTEPFWETLRSFECAPKWRTTILTPAFPCAHARGLGTSAVQDQHETAWGFTHV